MTARRRVNRLTIAKGRKRLSRRTRGGFTARQEAGMLRAWIGAKGASPEPARMNRATRLSAGFKPKRGRRKLGARRKISIIEQIVRWVRIPTGKVRRRSRSR